MYKYFGFTLFFIFVGMFSPLSLADQAEYQLGGGLMAFDYAEYGDNNDFLDGETGFIPGLVLKRKQNHQRLFSEFVGQFYGNIIEYDGQTQGGSPVKTDSVALILDTHFKLGVKLAENQEPYIGLGYRYWHRKILNGRDINGNGVSGLLEEYYWPYILFGYSASFNATAKVNVGFDLRYTKMLDAKMDINFLGYCGYDNARVNLGNESGARFAVPVQIKNRKHTLIITPYYEVIDIGKSNTISLTRNGNIVDCDLNGYYDGALEPRSETRNMGIEIMWLW